MVSNFYHVTRTYNQPCQFATATHLWRFCDLLELRENKRQQGSADFFVNFNGPQIGKHRTEEISMTMQKVTKEAMVSFQSKVL